MNTLFFPIFYYLYFASDLKYFWDVVNGWFPRQIAHNDAKENFMGKHSRALFSGLFLRLVEYRYIVRTSENLFTLYSTQFITEW